MANSTIATWALMLLAVATTQTPAHAEKASKEESIGVGTGAVVGAAAGGPVGFIIGAAIGAKIGDSYHRKNEQVGVLEGELGASQGRASRLTGEIGELNREIEQLQQVARPELVALMQAGIDMDLLFRTDEHVLTDSTGTRLERLATTLAAMPEVRIQLDGFADERGAADYNLALSERRVSSVRELLIAAGIHPTRIATAAHGESVAANSTEDDFALERRVSVKLFIDTAAIAAN